MDRQTLSIRRVVLVGVAGGLSLAAIVAIAALISGGDTDTHWQVIASSLWFSLATLTAAPGGALLRSELSRQVVGAITVGLAFVTLILTLVVIWSDPEESVFDAWLACMFASFAAAHAALMIGALRTTDSRPVRVLSATSIGLGLIDGAGAVAAAVGLVEDPSDGVVRLFAVSFVLLLLATALTPILRRLGRSDSAPPPAVDPGDLARAAEELRRIAARLEARDVLANADAARLRGIADALQQRPD